MLLTAAFRILNIKRYDIGRTENGRNMTNININNRKHHLRLLEFFQHLVKRALLTVDHSSGVFF